jgi:hypothetical protein
MPATNEEFIKKAFEAGLTEDQVRSAVAERNQRVGTKPKQGGLGSTVLDAVSRTIDIPSSLAGGAMKASREAVTGQYTPPDLKVGNFNLGNLIHPVAVGAVRGLKDHSTVMEELPTTLGVDPNSGAGVALGLAGEIATPDPLDFIKALKVGKKGIKTANEAIQKTLEKTGEKITKGGEEYVLKSLKPSKTQINKFFENTGEKLPDFMARNNFTDNFVERVASKVEDAQSAFDDISINSNKIVKNSDLYSSFNKVIGEMEDSILPEIKGRTDNVKEVFNNMINKYLPNLAEDIRSGKYIGEGGFNVGQLTKERKAIDKLIKGSQFNMPIEQATYLRQIRNALQETIQKSTEGMTYKGMNLKKLGMELKKLYEFDTLANLQANLGKGAMPIGLTDILSMGAGGMVGGWPGSLTGIALKRATQTPQFISAASKGLQGLGKKVSSSASKVAIPEATGSIFDALRRAAKVGIRQRDY